MKRSRYTETINRYTLRKLIIQEKHHSRYLRAEKATNEGISFENSVVSDIAARDR